ncbi:hypothetical protein QBK99_25385 [Corticibacterium sp. UT-5YL-CI-8]|nr:hypothetical protein [Tianweitania sp. UT-5YL-CI-8]
MDSPYKARRIPAVVKTQIIADGGFSIRAPAAANASYWGGCGSGGTADKCLAAVNDTAELPTYSGLYIYSRSGVGSPWTRSEVVCIRQGFIARPQTGRYHYLDGTTQKSKPDTPALWIGDVYAGFEINAGSSQIVDLS